MTMTLDPTPPRDHRAKPSELTATLHMNTDTEILCGPVPVEGDEPAIARFEAEGDPPAEVNALQIWRGMSPLRRMFFPATLQISEEHHITIRIHGDI